MRMWSVVRLHWIALAALLAACAQPVTPERASAIKTVGVISAMGDQFHLTTIGHVIFQYQDRIESVPTWDLDGFVLDQFDLQLSKRYDVRPVTADKAAFAPGVVYYPMTTNVFAANSLPSPIEAIRKSASPQELDAYFIVTPSDVVYGTTKQTVSGLGLVKGIAAFFSRKYYVHATYRVLVIDGHNGAVIGDAIGPEFNALEAMQGFAMPGPKQEVDASWWAETLDEMSPDQRQRVESKLKEVINMSVPTTLRRLKLIE